MSIRYAIFYIKTFIFVIFLYIHLIIYLVFRSFDLFSFICASFHTIFIFDRLPSPSNPSFALTAEYEYNMAINEMPAG